MTKDVQQQFVVKQIDSEKDADRVIDFLETFFMKDSPINSHLNIQRAPSIERLHRDYLTHGCSFQAIDSETGNILGVFLNKPLYAKNAGISSAHKITEPQYAIVVRFLEFLEAECPLFQKYPDCERAMEAGILSVDTSFRGLGIGKTLIERTIQFARNNRYPLITCMCSSKFSARICENAGFEEMFRYVMADWVDVVDGSRPLQIGAPHENAFLYSMRL